MLLPRLQLAFPGFPAGRSGNLLTLVQLFMKEYEANFVLDFNNNRPFVRYSYGFSETTAIYRFIKNATVNKYHIQCNVILINRYHLFLQLARNIFWLRLAYLRSFWAH